MQESTGFCGERNEIEGKNCYTTLNIDAHYKKLELLYILIMATKFLIIFFLVIGVNTKIFSQVTLIGNWRRVISVVKYKGSINKQNHWGDLEIRKDSTFRIQNDTTNQNSTTTGWHIDKEYNGTWQLYKGNHLFLYLHPKVNNMFLSFKIIKLEKRKLILRSYFVKNNKHDVRYIRS